MQYAVPCSVHCLYCFLYLNNFTLSVTIQDNQLSAFNLHSIPLQVKHLLVKEQPPNINIFHIRTISAP